MALAAASGALNQRTMVIVQIESFQGLKQAGAITALPCVDAILVGTNDLSSDFGIPGEYTNPQRRAAYNEIIATCSLHGKHALVGGIGDPEIVRRYINAGIANYMFAGNDRIISLSGASRVAEEALSALIAGED